MSLDISKLADDLLDQADKIISNAEAAGHVGHDRGRADDVSRIGASVFPLTG